MTQKKSNKLIYILGAIALVLIIVVVIGKKKGFIGDKKGVEVEVAKVAKNTIVEKVSATGKIHPVKEVKISSDVSGEIVELHVVEGDSVIKGQLLVKIRPDNYKSMLDQAIAGLNAAKANLAQAEARFAQTKANNIQTEQNFNRNKNLHEQKVISDAEFEQISASYQVSLQELEAAKQTVLSSKYNVESAKAAVVDARENLNKTEIYAPVSGTISKLAVQKGERVVGTLQMAGTELLRIANLNDMEIRVNVNENDIVRVSSGDTALIEVDSYSRENEVFKGVVTAIAHTANDVLSLDAVTEFEVKIWLINDSYNYLISEEKPFPFRPGMTATVDILTNTKHNILTVPISAVTTRSKVEQDNISTNEPSSISESEVQEVVFVVGDDQKVSQKIVKTGISDFDNIEIISGVNDGEVIVKGPYQLISKKLKDGDLVKIKKDEDENNEPSTNDVSIEVN